jgi:hypothetical protein
MFGSKDWDAKNKRKIWTKKINKKRSYWPEIGVIYFNIHKGTRYTDDENKMPWSSLLRHMIDKNKQRVAKERIIKCMNVELGDLHKIIKANNSWWRYGSKLRWEKKLRFNKVKYQAQESYWP